MELSPVIAFANRLADAAGEILRARFRAPNASEIKADNSPVTEVDRAVECALREMIAREYSTHGIFGEEESRENPDAEYQWVLDPIDGTRAFMAGYPLFTTLIALCESGVPILGVIDQPILRERWVGARGMATTLNGAVCKVAEISENTPLTHASTSMRYFTPEEAQVVSKLTLNFVPSGDAYAYAMLASGHLHAVVDGYMQPYDYMAHAPIIQGAGGVMTDWAGAPITLNSNGKVLASCSPALHHHLLMRLT